VPAHQPLQRKRCLAGLRRPPPARCPRKVGSIGFLTLRKSRSGIGAAVMQSVSGVPPESLWLAAIESSGPRNPLRPAAPTRAASKSFPHKETSPPSERRARSTISYQRGFARLITSGFDPLNCFWILPRIKHSDNETSIVFYAVVDPKWKRPRMEPVERTTHTVHACLKLKRIYARIN